MGKAILNIGLRLLIWLTAAVYGTLVYWLLFVRNRRLPIYADRNWLSDWQLNANLYPFRTIRQYVYHSDHYNLGTWVQMFIGNLILFFPFGILAPLLINRMRSLPRFILILFLLLLGLELAQLITMTGSFDVDDIILNMAGGLAGFVIIRGFLWTIKH